MPFFPQARYQCGPAALATVLVHSGLAIDPDQLSDAVYLPGRKGSLQPELLAATRRNGRVPYRIPGTVDALLDELRAGQPVLLLQNLGIDLIPRWHYAVLVGYDGRQRRWLLRSGVEPRQWESHGTFLRRWGKGDHWALVVTAPGLLPASVSKTQAVQALADAEPFLQPGQALAGWGAALARWPGEPDVLFGAANAGRRAGRTDEAADLYASLLARAPGHLAARNNYADLLLRAGCPERARQVLAPSLRQLDPDSPLAPTLRATAREIATASRAAPVAAPCLLATP